MRVDFHTHILPGIDDGAKDPEISRQMLLSLADDGVTDVVLTPHFYFRNQHPETFISRRQEAYERLLEIAPLGMRFHLGAEVEFSGAQISYDCYKLFTIDGGKYVLLELPYTGDFRDGIFKRLEQFIYTTGLRPIIAHTERYESIKKKPEQIADLINLGCLIQINQDAVLEIYKGSLADAMFKNGQVHLIGTDCHNMDTRRPNFLPAIQYIEATYGEEALLLLDGMAENVLLGEPIQQFAKNRIKKQFGRYK